MFFIIYLYIYITLSIYVTYTVDISTVHAICPHGNNNIFLIIIINNYGTMYII